MWQQPEHPGQDEEPFVPSCLCRAEKIRHRKRKAAATAMATITYTSISCIVILFRGALSSYHKSL